MTTPDQLRLDPSARRATWQGRMVTLTRGELALMHRLIEEAGDSVSYRALYDAIRGHGFHAGSGLDGYRVNVRAFMKRIRQKFREIDPEFDAIETRPGLGYRWRSLEQKQ